MKVEQEHITHQSSSFRLLRLEQAAFTNARHRHAHLELTWIEQGSGMRFVGDHAAPFAAGDLVLIGPHLPHTWLSARDQAGQPHVVTVLQVAPALLFNAVLPELGALGELVRRAARGLRVTGAAHAAATAALPRLAAARSELERLGLLLALLGSLCDNADCLLPLAGAGAAASPAGAGGSERERRIDRVVSWIGEHIGEPLTVAHAAALVHVSSAAFSRFFRRELGKSFTEYVNDVRCAEACLMLTSSDRPVAAVARACGFETLSNFNRHFRRRHGLSPGAYRRARGLG